MEKLRINKRKGFKKALPTKEHWRHFVYIGNLLWDITEKTEIAGNKNKTNKNRGKTYTSDENMKDGMIRTGSTHMGEGRQMIGGWPNRNFHYLLWPTIPSPIRHGLATSPNVTLLAPITLSCLFTVCVDGDGGGLGEGPYVWVFVF